MGQTFSTGEKGTSQQEYFIVPNKCLGEITMSTLEVRRIVGEIILYMEYFESHSTLEGAVEEDFRELLKYAREAWEVLTRTREREL